MTVAFTFPFLTMISVSKTADSTTKKVIITFFTDSSFKFALKEDVGDELSGDENPLSSGGGWE